MRADELCIIRVYLDHELVADLDDAGALVGLLTGTDGHFSVAEAGAFMAQLPALLARQLRRCGVVRSGATELRAGGDD